MKIIFLSIFIFSTVFKGYVYFLERSYLSLCAAFKKESQDLKLLKVEWVYLNQSSRLRELANDLLINWQAMTPDQLSDFNMISEVYDQ
jgi:hypothetical protein